MNAHEALLAAVKARFLVTPALASGKVERGRRRPVDLGSEQAIGVYFGGSIPQRGTIKGAPIDWLTSVRFDCVARGRNGVSGDEAALELHSQAWARLFEDAQLGGLVMDMEPEAVAPSDEEQLDTAIGMVSGGVLLRHRTSNNTLEV